MLPICSLKNESHFENTDDNYQNVISIYTKHAVWSGIGNGNCTDPKMLYKSIISKQEDIFMYSISLDFFQKEYTEILDTEGTNKMLNMYDTYFNVYGRCFTMQPTADYISYGVKKISFTLGREVDLYLHTPGMFETGIETVKIEQGLHYQKEMDIDYEVFKMLDYQGEHCIKHNGHNRDLCEHENLEKQSIDVHGCTTPFGPNKNKICRDPQIGMKVLQMYRENFQSNKNYTCKQPCTYILTRFTITKERYLMSNIAHLSLNFKKIIKVNESQYIYSTLSLIAEVGGYVGLFLGISVNQMTFLIDKLFSKNN